jgi:hypothetical protein
MSKPTREPHHFDPVKITITTTPHIARELRELVMTGHYGHNISEAAERVIAHVLEIDPPKKTR